MHRQITPLTVSLLPCDFSAFLLHVSTKLFTVVRKQEHSCVCNTTIVLHKVVFKCFPSFRMKQKHTFTCFMHAKAHTGTHQTNMQMHVLTSTRYVWITYMIHNLNAWMNMHTCLHTIEQTDLQAQTQLTCTAGHGASSLAHTSATVTAMARGEITTWKHFCFSKVLKVQLWFEQGLCPDLL